MTVSVGSANNLLRQLFISLIHAMVQMKSVNNFKTVLKVNFIMHKSILTLEAEIS